MTQHDFTAFDGGVEIPCDRLTDEGNSCACGVIVINVCGNRFSVVSYLIVRTLVRAFVFVRSIYRS